LLVVADPEHQRQHRVRGHRVQQQQDEPSAALPRATAFHSPPRADAAPATSAPIRVRSPLLDCTSSRITSTVSSPSLTASGICVTAKMERNLPSAPRNPLPGSGKASASCTVVTQYVDRSARNAPQNTAAISGTS